MSAHIEAKPGEIAESILLPGDPLRAKWIAETFLENAKCYNKIRGMLGYTGTYKGKRISVQGTGMGVPSTMIYCKELIKEYGVKNMIRVGSAGAYQEDLALRDIVIAMSASCTSAINNSLFGNYTYAPTANFGLLRKAVAYAEGENIQVEIGNVLTQDQFYHDNKESYKKWAEYGVLCVEMETSGIYSIAAKYKINALSILTISDSVITGELTSPQERETSFSQMVEIALETLL